MTPLKQTDVTTQDVPVLLKAVVIDDAFDDAVAANEIAIETFLYFYQLANEDDAFNELMSKYEVDLPDFSTSNGSTPTYVAFLNTLWKLRSKEDVREMVDGSLFQAKLQNLADLRGICENIRKHHFEVVERNSKTEDVGLFMEGTCKIIFLDYNLGPGPGPAAVENARKKAHAFYNACPEDYKPIIILMSSFDVAQELDQFKQDANLGNVIFRFAPKEKLLNDYTASLLVQAFKNESEQAHKLQRYISTLKASAGEALKTFYDDVNALTIDDYTFIHDATVPSQGHPFGDYLGWLYGAHWTNLLFRNPQLKLDKDSLDTLLSTKPSLHYSMPSPKVVEIYMSALFEDSLGEVDEFHPLSGQKIGKVIIGKLPHLHLGDIFHKEGEPTIWMVLNPQCDLERADDSAGEQSILLVPGSLNPFDAKTDLPNPKTELIIIANNQYRVVWNVRNIDTVPLKSFNERRTKKNWERKFRLRLPYALEVQQAFTSTIARLGLPVSPPLIQQVKVEVRIKTGKNATAILLEARKHYAFLAVVRKADKKIRFTLNFALDLKLELSNRKIEIADKRAAATGVQEVQSLADAERDIDSILTKFDDWFMTNYYTNLPGGSIGYSLPNYIGIVEGYKNEMDLSKLIVLINVLPDDQASRIQESENT